MASLIFAIRVLLLFSLLAGIRGYNNTCTQPSSGRVKQRTEYYPSVDMTKIVFDIELDDECDIARCRFFLNTISNVEGFENLIAIVESEIYWLPNGNLNIVAWIGTNISERCTAVDLCSSQLTCYDFAGILRL